MRALKATLDRHAIAAVAVIGGDGTLCAARDLWREGIPLVAIPKTIDNDVGGTDFSVGFHTAVQTAADAIDRLHTTAESHNRVMVVEVMGRHAGWIATCAGLAGGADMILVPERPVSIDDVCDHLRRRHDGGRRFSIVVVAEGATVTERTLQLVVADGQRTIAPTSVPTYTRAAHMCKPESGSYFETRSRHTSASTLASRSLAMSSVAARRWRSTGSWPRGSASRPPRQWSTGHLGTMMAFRKEQVIGVDLEEALSAPKPLDLDLYDAGAVFFG